MILVFVTWLSPVATAQQSSSSIVQLSTVCTTLAHALMLGGTRVSTSSLLFTLLPITLALSRTLVVIHVTHRVIPLDRNLLWSTLSLYFHILYILPIFLNTHSLVHLSLLSCINVINQETKFRKYDCNIKGVFGKSNS